MKRRDFLAKSSFATLYVTLGLSTPKVLLGKSSLEMAPKGSAIHSIGIYPPIGICRVGNSEKYFLSPEIPGIPANPQGGYKDGNNKIKKQAQRFRVYGFDKKGRVVREITHSKTESIKWSVKVANTKAAWYEFKNPLDMGDFSPGLPGKRRNDFFNGDDRDVLAITPEAVFISGENTNHDLSNEAFSMVGDFWEEPNTVKVHLGSVQTDEKGRLIVMPSSGKSSSATQGNAITNFADNDGWYDDWFDGWVKAEVTLESGETIDASPSWVACCGPDYAPEIQPFISLYDVVRDVMINGKENPLERKPEGKLSFRQEIYPLFRRLGLMNWTVIEPNLREDWVDTVSFLSEETMEKLADPSQSAEQQAFRDNIFKQFRSPEEYKLYDDSESYDEHIKHRIPYMLGSGVDYEFSPAHWFAMPETQFWILQQWKEGNFINDLDSHLKVDTTLRFDDIELQQQPAALTRAALEPLSGGAFHPGVELTWPMRQQAIYSDTEPYRIKIGQREKISEQVKKLGLLLKPETVFKGAKRAKKLSGETISYYGLHPDSPIGPQNPGDLTRWLGLPWTPDAFSCQSVLYSDDAPNISWWPALLPVSVLTEKDFNRLSDERLSDDQKLEIFYTRRAWTRGVSGIGYHTQGSYNDGLSRMIHLWSHMGFVIKKQRPNNLSEELKKFIPKEIYVETGRGSMNLMHEINGKNDV